MGSDINTTDPPARIQEQPKPVRDLSMATELRRREDVRTLLKEKIETCKNQGVRPRYVLIGMSQFFYCVDAQKSGIMHMAVAADVQAILKQHNLTLLRLDTSDFLEVTGTHSF